MPALRASRRRITGWVSGCSSRGAELLYYPVLVIAERYLWGGV